MIDNAQAETDTFALLGQGTMGFNQVLDLKSTVSIPQDLSASMTASAKGLEYLLSDDGKIVIPVFVSGRIPALAFLPDLEYLGKRIIANRGKEELQKVLDKVFGRNEETPAPSPPEQPSGQSPAPQTEKQKKPEQELIEGILDKIFR